MVCGVCGLEVGVEKSCPACGAAQAAQDPLIGQTLGDKYTIVDRIARGGHSTVYEARSPDGPVAVKVLPHAGERSGPSTERLRREGIVLERLVHPNVVRLLGSGETADGRPWLAMELLHGETLEAVLARVGTLSEGELLTILSPICAALQAAHDAGIIHRDIKPQNVLLAEEGDARRPKLLDFGIARFDGAAALTGTETVCGTPQYMAPEQWDGLKHADARSDVYSLGVMVYRALSGKFPFNADTSFAWMKKSRLDPPIDLTLALGSRTASPAVCVAVMKALAKDPQERPQSPMELLRALRPAPAGHRSTAPSRRWAAAALAVALLGTGGAFYVWRTWRKAPRRSGPPIVLLMDTPVVHGVYDAEVASRGGTNADTLSDLLSDFKISIQKETVPSTWNRESYVLELQPDLVVIHRSAFFHALNLELGFGYEPFASASAKDRWSILYRAAEDKLIAFMGLVATACPTTRFLVYSRGTGSGTAGWPMPEFRDQWVAQIEQRFPALRGRLSTMAIEGGVARGTFKNPRVADELRRRVRGILGV